MFMRMVYDEKLAQAAYLIGCKGTGEAIVVDPERDVDRYVRLAEAHGLRITAVAETHIHADFLSGARELAERGARVYVSDEGGEDWRSEWLDGKLGGTYDHRRLRDGDTFTVGSIEFKAVHTPGHTPEHLSYLVTDRASGATEAIGMLSGDFVFVGDLGRPDLLETAAGQTGAKEPAARRLFETAQRVRRLPEFLQVWPGHGAGSACGKALGGVPTSTIGYELRYNPALRAAGDDEQTFVDFILSGQPEPPLYFARMKRENRLGPAVLGELPYPPRITARELRAIDPRHAAIIDTRPWAAYASGHLPGSLAHPLNSSFTTGVGSMVDPGEPIYLVAEPARVEEAVRDLVRVGLDDDRGWLDPAELDAIARGGGEGGDGELETVVEATPEEAEPRIAAGELFVLDVRRADEYESGHLTGAHHVPHTRLAARLDEIPRDRPVLVYCHTGNRSGQAWGLMRRAGYQVIQLSGGTEAWGKRRRSDGATEGRRR